LEGSQGSAKMLDKYAISPAFEKFTRRIIMSRIVTYFCTALILAVSIASADVSKSGKLRNLPKATIKTLRAASALSAVDT